MLQWCQEHWLLTFLIICLFLVVLEGAIANICKVVIVCRTEKKREGV